MQYCRKQNYEETTAVGGCVYEQGRREKNEDSLALHKMRTAIGTVIMAVICDGMGGMDYGEIASGYVTECFSNWFYKELPEFLERNAGINSIAKAAKRVLFHAHNQLREYGNQRQIKTGTTVSMFLGIENSFFLIHVGDSGIFRIRRKAKKMTVSHEINGKLTCCIGIGKFPSPQYVKGKIRKGDGFLLVTDGLMHYISRNDYANICKARECYGAAVIHNRLKSMVKTALQRGEQDNMSAIYVLYHDF